MKHVYLDNFRGFNDTVVSFKQMNFLLGENSTGKTSLLGLINLLFSQNFWFSGDFNCAEFSFGNFADIVSRRETNQSTFTIGLMQTHDASEASNGEFTCLIRFVERKGSPIPEHIAAVGDDSVLWLRLENDTYRYGLFPLTHKGSTPTPRAIFHTLLKTPLDPGKVITKTNINTPMPSGVMNMLITLINEARQKNIAAINNLFHWITLRQNVAWIGPIRSNPKRTYDEAYRLPYSPTGDHIPYVLRQALDKSRTGTTSNSTLRTSLDSFGDQSGLFAHVEIKEFDKSEDSPFELRVRLKDSEPLRINTVGYGVSQALPIAVEFLMRDAGACFFVQQPEVHLHPRAQAAFGDLIFQLASTERKQFVIETHSDFMIDRFRLNLKKEKKAHTSAQVLFFERKGAGNKVTEIEIMRNGEYDSNQPAAFRDFFLNEQLAILGL